MRLNTFEKYIIHPLFRRLLDHPQQDRFTRAQFAEALEQNGFTVSKELKRRFIGIDVDSVRVDIAKGLSLC